MRRRSKTWRRPALCARLAWLPAALLLAAAWAPTCRGQESAIGPATLGVDQLLGDVQGYQGAVIAVRGVGGQTGWARVPKGLQASWALVPPGGGPGIAVVDADDPGLGTYVEVRGEVRLDRFDDIPYLANVTVEELHELPMWERPFDRQTLMAVLAILLPPTAVLLVLTAIGLRRGQPRPPSPELFERRLREIPAAHPAAPAEGETVARPAATEQALVFTVRAGPDEGRRFVAAKESISIGRRPDRDIALTDRSVARFEATMVFREGRAILRAESPHTLVSVNGHPINEALVADGDVIRVGMTELVVSREAAPPQPVAQP